MVKQKSNVNINLVNKITHLFERKGWHIIDSPDDPESLFSRFCNMLDGLKPEQQELILKLTERYLRVNFKEYLSQFKLATSQVEKNIIERAPKIYIMPLLPKEDIGKSKSSTFLAHLCKGVDFKYDKLYSRTKFFVIDTIESLPQNFNSGTSIIFLVDDFIGTGETAEAALNFLVKDTGILQEKIIIISLVAQKEGINRLLKLGAKVYSSVIRDKGITDMYSNPIRRQYLSIMRKIENIIADNKKFRITFRFGYGKSEALVTMHRTPNNTFPIYWHESKKRGRYSAPFPRN